MLLHRYLISRTSGYARTFVSAARRLQYAALSFEREWREQGLWDDVSPHIAGYEWLHPRDRRTLIFVLLDDELALMQCEMFSSIHLWQDLVSFDLEIMSDGSVPATPLRRYNGATDDEAMPDF